MCLSELPLESISLPVAVFSWEPGQPVHLNTAFRVLMEARLGSEQTASFEDLDSLLGGQLRDFDRTSKGPITQEV